ncbi:T9SS type A sorting domain-containing protein [Cryomorpha ignava]|uniref:T9SS type A sorting domain-containing protein n=1 Tax=Cryomorpha ignava TaxID=101383 RepID=A0A7K3WQF4_9FLAO|nr:T9SS type A sorting domain-containing protein [Cryomorpha ignava]NEN23251.1 T9SS type A sorting domain-containing protein [Cryomorpha ignava]
MNKIYLLAIVMLFSLSGKSQISHGGEPFDWNERGSANLNFEAMPAIDLETLKREDAIFDQQKDIPWRFGANIPVDLDINNSGNWTILQNGDRIWKLSIKAKGALTINFVFDQYHLPEGGKVFVYDIDKKQLLGSFTSENASPESSLGVGFIFSDQLVISYYEPAGVAGQGYLHINNVTHGYRNVLLEKEIEAKGPFGTSEACNVNVNCPEGLPYGIQKRSVALIVVGNNGHCTGALINNTSQDLTQYFLTANHCLGAQGNWILYFNYETPDCDGNGDAPINQSVSGATLKAKNAESDFALLEINNPIPDSYNVCYSGWDATDDPNTLASAYGIHHPAGDIKKISIENDVPTQTALGGFVHEVWFVNNWELGVTQGGSSGSPLFNQSGRIIGQLAGGQADCIGNVNNGQYDYYGRFGVSWDFGDTPVTRLKDWLDPGNTGMLIVPNSCAGSEPTIDASLVEINGIETPTCSLEPLQPTINVLNTGSETITEITLSLTINELSQNNINWSGSIEPFSFTDISLGVINPVLGANNIEVEIIDVNGETDAVIAGNYRATDYYGNESSQTISLGIIFDNYPLETTWRLETESGFVLASGSGNSAVAQIEENICVGLGCYTFIIEDSENDGICCAYGTGSYTLTDMEGAVLASGGQFGSQQSTDFCISTVVDIPNAAQEFISIYPNPTNNLCHIYLGDTANSVLSIQVTDAIGKVVIRQTNFGSNARTLTMATARFGEGIYFVTIQTTMGTATRRIVVIR